MSKILYFVQKRLYTKRKLQFTQFMKLKVA